MMMTLATSMTKQEQEQRHINYQTYALYSVTLEYPLYNQSLLQSPTPSSLPHSLTHSLTHPLLFTHPLLLTPSLTPSLTHSPSSRSSICFSSSGCPSSFLKAANFALCFLLPSSSVFELQHPILTAATVALVSVAVS
jgi:hypothetical protein